MAPQRAAGMAALHSHLYPIRAEFRIPCAQLGNARTGYMGLSRLCGDSCVGIRHYWLTVGAASPGEPNWLAASRRGLGQCHRRDLYRVCHLYATHGTGRPTVRDTHGMDGFLALGHRNCHTHIFFLALPHWASPLHTLATDRMVCRGWIRANDLRFYDSTGTVVFCSLSGQPLRSSGCLSCAPSNTGRQRGRDTLCRYLRHPAPPASRWDRTPAAQMVRLRSNADDDHWDDLLAGRRIWFNKCRPQVLPIFHDRDMDRDPVRNCFGDPALPLVGY